VAVAPMNDLTKARPVYEINIRRIKAMKKLAVIILAILVAPVAVLAGEFKATVVKMDKAKNQIVVRTDKGEETLQVKGVKGSENAKEGARIMVKVNDKDGKVSEITPSE
jgi:hypothetical protein